MDASFPLARLIEEFGDLLDRRDYQGAEELLAGALGQAPCAEHAAFLHLYYGRLYRRWNKLTSAIHHLNHAAELAAARDQFLTIQIVEELRAARQDQDAQRP